MIGQVLEIVLEKNMAVITILVALMWWVDQMSFLLVLVCICLTLGQTPLVIWVLKLVQVA
jgi:hypothetical protein